jgi:hypothetical protein
VRVGDPIYWDQGADSLGEAQDYRYSLYVAGQPQVLAGHRCTNSSNRNVFTCSANLPASLPAGLVTIAVSAVRSLNGATYESQRSATIDVWVLTAAAAAAAKDTVTALRIPGSNEDPQDDPVDPLLDLAALPDGRLLSVDASGRVALVEDGKVGAAALDSAGGSVQIVSLAAASDFARSRVVYAVEAAEDGGTEVWDVTRYREVEGTLGERAVLVPAIATRVGTQARLRVGPDRLVYLAIHDAPAASGRSQTVSLFRFESDGSVPVGQSTRQIRSGVRGGLAFDWHPATGAPWIGSPDIASGVFVAGAPGTRLAALVLARADGSIERRVVSAGNFDRIVRTDVVKLDAPGDATALVRSHDGTIRAALSTKGSAPAVLVLDPK